MKTLLRLEELLIAIFAFVLFLPLGYAWRWFFLLLLAPDLSMLGYLGGPKLGALTYNLAHHRGLAIVLYLIGLALALPVLQFAGLLLLGHASLDRVFGYGLKYSDSFQNTHLGRIGAQRP
ncbi:MAG: DUF4260 family protein [Anaerolineae bacterium]|nr:MAG: DUF4260 family protein [Anaerolineae bacterium]